MADPYTMDPSEMFDAAEERHLLAEALALMSKDERDVVMSLWGIESEPESESKIARRLMIDVDDVRQIFEIASTRIRRHIRHSGQALPMEARQPARKEGPKRRPKMDFSTVRLTPPIRGFLYAVEFSNEIVKVGRSVHPHRRIASHEANALRHGVKVTRQWVSDEHGDSALSEEHLLEMCSSASKPTTGRECFRLPFEDVVRAARFAIERVPGPCPGLCTFRWRTGDPVDAFRGFKK